jgi:hypothetical protein
MQGLADFASIATSGRLIWRPGPARPGRGSRSSAVTRLLSCVTVLNCARWPWLAGFGWLFRGFRATTWPVADPGTWPLVVWLAGRAVTGSRLPYPLGPGIAWSFSGSQPAPADGAVRLAGRLSLLAGASGAGAAEMVRVGPCTVTDSGPVPATG